MREIPSHIPATVYARFAERFEKRGPDECWPWRGRLHKGYGSFSIAGTALKAHRAAMFLFAERPAAGQHVDHICRNRACVNPAHLRNVSPRINTLENSVSIPAINAEKTHCIRGHELTHENIYRTGPNGRWRMCKTCTAMHELKRRKPRTLKGVPQP